MGILKIQNLKKAFGGLLAVNDVSFNVVKGEVRAVIGPNGAGKSTFFNLVTGLIPVTTGSVYFKEENLTGLPPHKVVKKGVGRSFQITNIFQRMSVIENVQAAVLSHYKKSWNFFSPVRNIGEINDKSFSVLDSVGLLDKYGSPASSLSHGDQKRLEIGISLAGDPELLLLDEPTAGMSKLESKETVALIRKISEERGITLVFTEHDMDIVFGISDMIVVLQQGSVIAEGLPDEIKADKEVRKAYLGED